MNQKMTFKVSDLLETIKINRVAHRQTFERALTGYKKRVEEELDRRLADLRAGRKIDLFIQLEEPHDHTKDYDCVIRMLEMTTQQELELAHNEFKCYVLDEWSWKQDFVTTSSRYV